MSTSSSSPQGLEDRLIAFSNEFDENPLRASVCYPIGTRIALKQVEHKGMMMKKYFWIGIVFSLTMAVTACAVAYDDEGALVYDEDTAAVVVDEMLSDETISDEPYSELSSDGPAIQATGDCSVSVTCSDGSTKSCSGTNSSCSASSSGPRVTCNGSAQVCPSSGPSCGFCRGNTSCNDNCDCGFDGICSNRRCICL